MRLRRFPSIHTRDGVNGEGFSLAGLKFESTQSHTSGSPIYAIKSSKHLLNQEPNHTSWKPAKSFTSNRLRKSGPAVKLCKENPAVKAYLLQ